MRRRHYQYGLSSIVGAIIVVLVVLSGIAGVVYFSQRGKTGVVEELNRAGDVGKAVNEDLLLYANGTDIYAVPKSGDIRIVKYGYIYPDGSVTGVTETNILLNKKMIIVSDWDENVYDDFFVVTARGNVFRLKQYSVGVGTGTGTGGSGSTGGSSSSANLLGFSSAGGGGQAISELNVTKLYNNVVVNDDYLFLGNYTGTSYYKLLGGAYVLGHYIDSVDLEQLLFGDNNDIYTNITLHVYNESLSYERNDPVKYGDNYGVLLTYNFTVLGGNYNEGYGYYVTGSSVTLRIEYRIQGYGVSGDLLERFVDVFEHASKPIGVDVVYRFLVKVYYDAYRFYYVRENLDNENGSGIYFKISGGYYGDKPDAKYYSSGSYYYWYLKGFDDYLFLKWEGGDYGYSDKIFLTYPKSVGDGWSVVSVDSCGDSCYDIVMEKSVTVQESHVGYINWQVLGARFGVVDLMDLSVDDVESVAGISDSEGNVYYVYPVRYSEDYLLDHYFPYKPLPGVFDYVLKYRVSDVDPYGQYGMIVLDKNIIGNSGFVVFDSSGSRSVPFRVVYQDERGLVLLVRLHPGEKYVIVAGKSGMPLRSSDVMTSVDRTGESSFSSFSGLSGSVDIVMDNVLVKDGVLLMPHYKRWVLDGSDDYVGLSGFLWDDLNNGFMVFGEVSTVSTNWQGFVSSNESDTGNGFVKILVRLYNDVFKAGMYLSDTVNDDDVLYVQSDGTKRLDDFVSVVYRWDRARVEIYDGLFVGGSQSDSRAEKDLTGLTGLLIGKADGYSDLNGKIRYVAITNETGVGKLIDGERHVFKKDELKVLVDPSFGSVYYYSGVGESYTVVLNDMGVESDQEKWLWIIYDTGEDGVRLKYFPVGSKVLFFKDGLLVKEVDVTSMDQLVTGVDDGVYDIVVLFEDVKYNDEVNYDLVYYFNDWNNTVLNSFTSGYVTVQIINSGTENEYLDVKSASNSYLGYMIYNMGIDFTKPTIIKVELVGEYYEWAGVGLTYYKNANKFILYAVKGAWTNYLYSGWYDGSWHPLNGWRSVSGVYTPDGIMLKYKVKDGRVEWWWSEDGGQTWNKYDDRDLPFQPNYFGFITRAYNGNAGLKIKRIWVYQDTGSSGGVTKDNVTVTLLSESYGKVAFVSKAPVGSDEYLVKYIGKYNGMYIGEVYVPEVVSNVELDSESTYAVNGYVGIKWANGFEEEVNDFTDIQGSGSIVDYGGGKVFKLVDSCSSCSGDLEIYVNKTLKSGGQGRDYLFWAIGRYVVTYASGTSGDSSYNYNLYYQTGDSSGSVVTGTVYTGSTISNDFVVIWLFRAGSDVVSVRLGLIGSSSGNTNKYLELDIEDIGIMELPGDGYFGVDDLYERCGGIVRNETVDGIFRVYHGVLSDGCLIDLGNENMFMLINSTDSLFFDFKNYPRNFSVVNEFLPMLKDWTYLYSYEKLDNVYGVNNIMDEDNIVYENYLVRPVLDILSNNVMFFKDYSVYGYPGLAVYYNMGDKKISVDEYYVRKNTDEHVRVYDVPGYMGIGSGGLSSVVLPFNIIVEDEGVDGKGIVFVGVEDDKAGVMKNDIEKFYIALGNTGFVDKNNVTVWSIFDYEDEDTGLDSQHDSVVIDPITGHTIRMVNTTSNGGYVMLPYWWEKYEFSYTNNTYPGDYGWVKYEYIGYDGERYLMNESMTMIVDKENLWFYAPMPVFVPLKKIGASLDGVNYVWSNVNGMTGEKVGTTEFSVMTMGDVTPVDEETFVFYYPVANSEIKVDGFSVVEKEIEGIFHNVYREYYYAENGSFAFSESEGDVTTVCPSGTTNLYVNAYLYDFNDNLLTQGSKSYTLDISGCGYSQGDWSDVILSYTVGDELNMYKLVVDVKLYGVNPGDSDTCSEDNYQKTIDGVVYDVYERECYGYSLDYSGKIYVETDIEPVS